MYEVVMDSGCSPLFRHIINAVTKGFQSLMGKRSQHTHCGGALSELMFIAVGTIPVIFVLSQSSVVKEFTEPITNQIKASIHKSILFMIDMLASLAASLALGRTKSFDTE